MDISKSANAKKLVDRMPWVNNGFVVGFLGGLAGGVGLIVPIMPISLMILFAKNGPPQISNAVSCGAFLISIGLGAFLHRTINKALIKRGFDGPGYRGKGVGRVILAVVGTIVGVLVGGALFACGIQVILTPLMFLFINP